MAEHHDSAAQAGEAPAAHAAHAPAAHAEHGASVPVLALTLSALLILTFITVAVTWVAWLDFGPRANLWIALIIATIKATLVALYFMHLRYDKPFNGVVLITALFFVALFVGAALQYSLAYKPNIEEFRGADPTRNYAPDLAK